MIRILPRKIKRKSSALQFLTNSPTYCQKTVGRICTDISNCGTLCCGRGFQRSFIKVYNHCMCQKEGCCRLKCHRCLMEKPVLICK